MTRRARLTLITPMRVTADTVVYRHLDWARRSGLGEQTRIQRRRLLDGLNRWLTSHRSADLLTADRDDLDAWQSHLANTPSSRTGAPVSLTAIACYTSHVRMFYEWASRSGIVDRDPSSDLPMPKVEHGRPSPIPEDELQLAIRCAPEPLKTWFVLAAYAGLRGGEIAVMRREDVRDREPLPVVDVRGKGHHGQISRTEPLSAEVLLMLAPHLHRRGPLWTMQSGRPMTPHRLQQIANTHLRNLGITSTLHKLRHRAASQAYQRSRDILAVQRLLGHKTVQTTTIYAEPVPTAVREIADNLGMDLATVLRLDDRRGRRTG